MIIITDPDELVSSTSLFLIEMAQLFQLNGMDEIFHFAGTPNIEKNLRELYKARYTQAFPFTNEVYQSHSVLTSATYLQTLPRLWCKNIKKIVALVDSQTNLDYAFTENVSLIGDIDHPNVSYIDVGFETRFWKRDNIDEDNDMWYMTLKDNIEDHLVNRLLSWLIAYNENAKIDSDIWNDDSELNPAAKYFGYLHLPTKTRNRTPFEFWFYQKPVIFFSNDKSLNCWFGEDTNFIPLVTPFIYKRELFPQWCIPKDIFYMLE